MSKIIRVYNGIEYKNIECEEILTSDNKPTGYFRQISEEKDTVLGIYLDNFENLQNFKEIIDGDKFRRIGNYRNNICLLTDYSNIISLISSSLSLGYKNYITFNSWSDWALAKISELGYVNHECEYNIDAGEKDTYIKIPITPKNGIDPEYDVYLIPMDVHCDLFVGK